MFDTLRALHNVVEPHLPASLVIDRDRQMAARWAEAQPPVAWAGFESPLIGERWLDFHQGFRRNDLQILRGCRQRLNLGSLSILFDHIARYWDATDDRVAGFVANMILEYDARGQSPGAPALFVGLNDPQDNSALVAEDRLSRLDALYGLAGMPPELSNKLQCLAVCAAPGFISHVGLMPSRGNERVRINLRSLRPSLIIPLCQQLGWLGRKPQLQQWVDRLAPLSDRVVVCIDLLKRSDGEYAIGPRIGLECTVDGKWPFRWHALLQVLVETGLSSSENAMELLRWLGTDTPFSASSRWPLGLLIQAIRCPEKSLSYVSRYISHIKVSVDDSENVEAKAYFGYRGETPAVVATVARPCQSSSARALPDAIGAAVEFIAAARGQTGFLTDFTQNGTTDEWVTAYAAEAVASAGTTGLALAMEFWAWLRKRERPGGGWGFDRGRPADADSTTWALRLAAKLDQTPRQASVDFLLAHKISARGLRTYLPSEELAAMTGVPISKTVGWTSPHLCVTAAAASLASLADSCTQALISTQATDGHWPGYWWSTPEYATALAVEALASRPGSESEVSIELAASWAANQLQNFRDATPFELALRIRVLLASDSVRHRYETVLGQPLDWLLEQQTAAGGWDPSARLRIPPPDALDPSLETAGTIHALDDRGLLTTATVLSALSRFRQDRE